MARKLKLSEGTMPKYVRVALSDRARFEVFKRDQFTCQYCGGKAPDVVLNCDHINPVADGGTNELMNLVTSCRTCNSGKSDKKLSDSSSVEKSRAQAELLEERRQQIKMMADWQIELARMEPELEAINEATLQLSGRTLSESGKRRMRQSIRRFSFQDVLEAVTIAIDQYEEIEAAMSKVNGIAYNLKQKREDPKRSELTVYFKQITKDLPKSYYYWKCLNLVLSWHRDGYETKSILVKLPPHANAWSRLYDIIMALDMEIRK